MLRSARKTPLSRLSNSGDALLSLCAARSFQSSASCSSAQVYERSEATLANLGEVGQEIASRPLPPGSGLSSTLLTQSVLPQGSRRTGVIAVKAGMTQEWDSWGQRVPLTVLWIDDCEVVQTKTTEGDGYYSLQLGIGAKRDKQLHTRQVGHFASAGVQNKRKLAEFRVTADALLPPRTKVTASHFAAGQYVDIQGTTIGKGFQGVMKKWGFAGQPASHGNSLAHRAPGSIGGCQDPGKVWPGKKMAGRMGNVSRTVQSALLYKVDPHKNLLYVRGQVPGHKGNFVLIKDAVRKLHREQPERPFPTHLEELKDVVEYAPRSERNPFEKHER